MIACCVVIIVTLITPFFQVVSPLGKRMPGWFRNFLTCRVGSYTNVDRLGCPRSYFTYHIAQEGYYSVMKWILRFHFVWMRIRILDLSWKFSFFAYFCFILDPCPNPGHKHFFKIY